MKKNIIKRIMAVFMVFVMMFTCGAFDNIKIAKAATDTITLTFGGLYERTTVEEEDENGKKEKKIVDNPYSDSELYRGNSESTTVLGTTTGLVNGDVYIDAGSRIDFDVDNTGGKFQAYFTSSTSSEDNIGDSLAVSGGYSECQNTADGKATFKLVGDKLQIAYYDENGSYNFSNKSKDFFIRLTPMEGSGRSYTIAVHVLQSDEVAIEGETASVRQGQNRGLELVKIIRDDKGEIIGRSDNVCTDGYEWTVGNYSTTDEEAGVMGEISVSGTGATLHQQQNSAIFSAYADRGTGSVYITAKSTSGIRDEDNTKSFIAIKRRGVVTSAVLPVEKWIPATKVAFVGDKDDAGFVNYNYLKGTTLNLGSMITAESESFDSNGKMITPNDVYTYTSSNEKVASVKGSTLTLKGTGDVDITVSAENTNVTDKCKIHVFNKTNTLKIMAGDNDLSGSQTTMRAKNELILDVVEDKDANEPLKWNESAIEDYFTCELIGNTGNKKTYRFTAKNVTEVKDVDLVVSTDRDGEDVGQINNTVRVKISPAISDDSTIKSFVSFSGGEEVETDEVNFYEGENLSLLCYPYDSEGVRYTLPDQIVWDTTSNKQYVDRTDYLHLGLRNTSATKLTWLGAGDETTTITATSMSNSAVTKTIKVNAKQLISEVDLKVGETTGTPSIALGKTAQINAVVTPTNAAEKLMYVSEYPDYISVGEDTGLLEAKKSTSELAATKSGVNIRVYAYHSHGPAFSNGKDEKRLVGTIKVKGVKAGNVEIDPINKDIIHTNNTPFTYTFKAYENGSSIQNPNANWAIENDKVVEFNTFAGTTVTATQKLIGETVITAEYGGQEAESQLKVYGLFNEEAISITGIDSEYEYLPNGEVPNITPVITSQGIDSRADESGKYTLVEGEDYVVKNTYEKGKNQGGYKIEFRPGDNLLYRNSGTTVHNIQYKVVPKVIGDGTNADSDIVVEQTNSLTYNGSAQSPVYKISYKKGDNVQELVAGKDYKLTASATDAGIHEATITGLGNFSGSFTVEYTIAKVNVGTYFDDVRIAFNSSGSQSIPDQMFNGTAVSPKLEIYAILKDGTTSWSNKLTVNKDYEIAFSDNDKVGEATATVTGKGNYEGTFSQTYNITPKLFSDTASSNGGTVTIPTIPSQVYTGYPIIPSVNVVLGSSIPLVYGVDYDVVCTKNVDSYNVSGENAVFKIIGKGNYAGEKQATFRIDQADLSNTSLVKVKDIPTQYDCSALLTPSIDVYMGDYNLVKGKDYDIIYGNSKTSPTTAYNYHAGNGAGVVTIVPVSGSNVKTNFKATTSTTILKEKGQEVFFDIANKDVKFAADDISIKNANGNPIEDDKIFVNKKGTTSNPVVNSTVEYDIEAIKKDGTECDDIVFASSTSNDIFSFKTVVEDGTKGNKAKLLVTGNKAGTATLTLVTQEGMAKNVTVVVNEPATAVDITLRENPDPKSKTYITESSGSYSVYENHDYYLGTKLTASTSTDTVNWTSSNDSVASVDSEGKLTTYKSGTVSITATTKATEVHPGGVYKTIRVVVMKNIMADNVTLSADKLNLYIDKEEYKTAKLTGTATSNEGNVTELLEWTSTNESVVKIKEGQGTALATIEAVGPGKAIITYGSKLAAGVKASCEVEVTATVSSVSLSDSAQTVIEGNSINLTATLNEYASDAFVWTISKPNVVEMSGNNEEYTGNAQTVSIKGVKAGSSVNITVKAKSNNQVTASCKVTVIQDPTKPTPTPTPKPTASPTDTPTDTPTQVPTTAPTVAPTEAPTVAPTDAPTKAPTAMPTVAPIVRPTLAPVSSANPSAEPSSTVTPGMPTNSADPTIASATPDSGVVNQGAVVKVSPTKILSAKGKKKKITLKLKKVPGAKYEIVYSLKKNFKKKKKKISSKNKVVLKGLKKGKKYYIKVRAFKIVDESKKYDKFTEIIKVKKYSKFSKVVKVKVKR